MSWLQDTAARQQPHHGSAACCCGHPTPQEGTTRAVHRVPTTQLRTVRPPLDVMFVLDASSSMRGGPSRAALAAAQRIAQTHLTGPHDHVSALLVNNTVRQVLQRTRAKHVDWDALHAQRGDGHGGLACSDGTALWDGVYTALHCMCYREADTRPDGSKHRLPHPYVMVLTDGGDNASSPAVTDMVGEGLLRKPSLHGLTGAGMAHLKVHFLTVGPHAPQRIKQAMRLGPTDDLPQHVALLRADEGTGVAALLAQAEKRVLQHVTVLTTTHTTVLRGRGPPADAARETAPWRGGRARGPPARGASSSSGSSPRSSESCGPSLFGPAWHTGRRSAGWPPAPRAAPAGASSGHWRRAASPPQEAPKDPPQSTCAPADDSKQALMRQLAELMAKLQAA